jgi:hypothetical protein
VFRAPQESGALAEAVGTKCGSHYGRSASLDTVSTRLNDHQTRSRHGILLVLRVTKLGRGFSRSVSASGLRELCVLLG